jgi:hypothetical protein
MLRMSAAAGGLLLSLLLGILLSHLSSCGFPAVESWSSADRKGYPGNRRCSSFDSWPHTATKIFKSSRLGLHISSGSWCTDPHHWQWWVPLWLSIATIDHDSQPTDILSTATYRCAVTTCTLLDVFPHFLPQSPSYSIQAMMPLRTLFNTGDILTLFEVRWFPRFATKFNSIQY